MAGRYHPPRRDDNNNNNNDGVVENLSWKIWLPIGFFIAAVIVIIAMVAVILDSNVTKVSNQNLKDEIRKECGASFFNGDDDYGNLEKLFVRYCDNNHKSDECESQYNNYVNARFQHTYRYMDTCVDKDSDWSKYMKEECVSAYGNMKHHFDVRMNYMYEIVKHGCGKHLTKDDEESWDVKDLKEYVGDKFDWMASKLDLIVVSNHNENNIDNDVDIIIDNENSLDLHILGQIDSATSTLLGSLTNVGASVNTLGSSLLDLSSTLTILQAYLGMFDEEKRNPTNLRQFIAKGFETVNQHLENSERTIENTVSSLPAHTIDYPDVDNNNNVGDAQLVGQWSSAGADLDNSKYNPHMKVINRNNVKTIRNVWKHKVGGTVGSSATPTTDGKLIFSTDFNGDIFGLSRETGKPVWKRSVKDVLGITDPDVVVVSRTSPVVYDNCLGQECVIFGAPGDRSAGGFPQFGGFFYEGPVKMFALNRHTGATIWISPDLEDHPWSQISTSPSIAEGKLFGGIYSLEIVAPLIDSDYPCCSFRGSAFALDAETGELLWQTYTIPEQKKANTRNNKNAYAGAGIKGSSPSVDTENRLVFFGTSQFSMFPARISSCLLDEVRNGKYPGESNFNCLEEDTYPDSILAMNIDTGAVMWSLKASGIDGWNPTCVINTADPNCPKPVGFDYDFSQSPTLYSVGNERRVFTFQKSGFAYSLRASDGEFRWSRYLPTGLLGGGSWGCAHDKKQNGFVCQITGASVSFLGNSEQLTYELADGSLACDASWWYLDGEKGEVKWQTKSPYARDSKHCPAVIGNAFIRGMKLQGPNGNTPVSPSKTAVVGKSCEKRDKQSPTAIENSQFAKSYGALAIGNELVYVTEMTGNMYALDVKTGDCLALIHCDQGSIYGAPSLHHGNKELVTVGCGYGRLRKEWTEYAGCEEGQCSVNAFGLSR